MLTTWTRSSTIFPPTKEDLEQAGKYASKELYPEPVPTDKSRPRARSRSPEVASWHNPELLATSVGAAEELLNSPGSTAAQATPPSMIDTPPHTPSVRDEHIDFQEQSGDGGSSKQGEKTGEVQEPAAETEETASVKHTNAESPTSAGEEEGKVKIELEITTDDFGFVVNPRGHKTGEATSENLHDLAPQEQLPRDRNARLEKSSNPETKVSVLHRR